MQKRFDSGDRIKAQRERLARELELRKSRVSHEVVLLEAADEAALDAHSRALFQNAPRVG